MSEECMQYRNQIPRALLGDLNQGEQQRLDTHLAECSGCKQEHELYTNTVKQLRTVGDCPVPRHFFVYGANRSESPWQLFRRMSLGWQFGLASVALAMAVLGILTVARLQVRFEGSVMLVSFGNLPAPIANPMPTSAVSSSALEARILRTADERTRKEILDWVRTLREEIAQGNRRLGQQQHAILETALANLETRTGNRIFETAQSIEARTEKSVSDLYTTVNLQRERDVNAFNDQLTRVAVNTETRSDQTDVILDALLQAAELRLKQ
jgi:hypothetical protein